jgi:hypothetical protein
MQKIALSALAAVAAFAATPAAATVMETFSISVDGSSGSSLGTAPYGTVTVTDNGDGTLTFVESLLSGYGIHETTSDQHDAFAFSIIGDPALTITGLPSGFTAQNTTSSSSNTQPPFGTFQTQITCATSACGHGSPGYTSPLSFTVAATGTTLTLASLGYNVVGSNNIYFSTDLVYTSGRNSFTGNAGAVLTTPAVPEPTTWAMLLVGFGGMGAALRRKRRAAQMSQFA